MLIAVTTYIFLLEYLLFEAPSSGSLWLHLEKQYACRSFHCSSYLPISAASSSVLLHMEVLIMMIAAMTYILRRTQLPSNTLSQWDNALATKLSKSMAMRRTSKCAAE